MFGTIESIKPKLSLGSIEKALKATSVLWKKKAAMRLLFFSPLVSDLTL